MKVIARTDEYTIYQKRNQRYGVRKVDRQWVNGNEKVEILLKHDLVKAPPPKAAEPEPVAAEAEEAQPEAEGDAGEAEEPSDD